MLKSPKKSAKNPLPSEEIHLPGPHPARGIYGFALYITAWCGLVIYVLWAVLPVQFLNRLGITYFPSKLWALIIGFIFQFAAIAYVVVIFIINCIRFEGYSVFDNVELVNNDFGDRSILKKEKTN
ncbi:unnamed protein product [Caenorhabditis bovis]|uniref:PIG-P domain-containing protein n=1 Tax=Caenorhabditis bovis TaxID=2654633 RepID=A0A8S1FBP7_9PELO|nr:unnamed protein product [Caenorhabditis bovis]